MTVLVLGLIIFFAPHTFTMFRGARTRLIDKLGEGPYKGLYSVVVLIGLVVLVMGYSDAPKIGIWVPPLWMRHVTMLLMLPVFILAAAANMPGHIKAKVKNPLLMATKTWALAHLLANGDVASLLLFGAFLTFGVVDLIAVKRTDRSSVVTAPKAMYDVVAIVVGLALYALIVFWAHVYISGVPLFLS